MIRPILEFALRAILMAAAAAAVLRVLRIRGAAAQHAIWTGVVAAMLLLPLWLAWGPQAGLPVLPSSADGAVVFDAAPRTPAVAPPAGLAPPATQSAGGNWHWDAVSIAIYLLGAVTLLLRLAIGTIRARRLTAARTTAPVTVGLFHPRVILPESSREWPPAKLDAVLAHERAHARRRDPLVAWLALLNRALFWFHPLAWWLERRLAALAEEACDAAVLARGHDPRAYSGYLLDLARAVERAGARIDAAGLAMPMPGSHLPRRIRRMLAGRMPPPVSRPRLAGAAVACALSAAFAAAARPQRARRRSRHPRRRRGSQSRRSSAVASRWPEPAAAAPPRTPEG